MSNAKERSFIGAIGTRPEIRLFFIFGQDESAAADIASQMSAVLKGSERIDIDSDRIRNDPALLADEASALSLFGDKRHIRLNFRREEGVAAVENLLALEGEANPVIATAGFLVPQLFTANLVERSPRKKFFPFNLGFFFGLFHIECCQTRFAHVCQSIGGVASQQVQTKHQCKVAPVCFVFLCFFRHKLCNTFIFRLGFFGRWVALGQTIRFVTI